MTHCYMCFRRFEDDETPLTHPLPALHQECYDAYASAAPCIQAEWLKAHASGTLTQVANQTRNLEDEHDRLELQAYGENSRHMPQPTADAVKRLIYAISVIQANNLPEHEALAMAALAWKADHRTGTVTISDDELHRCTEAIRPTVSKALQHNPFLQASYFRQFLRDHDRPVHAGTVPPKR